MIKHQLNIYLIFLVCVSNLWYIFHLYLSLISVRWNIGVEPVSPKQTIFSVFLKACSDKERLQFPGTHRDTGSLWVSTFRTCSTAVPTRRIPQRSQVTLIHTIVFGLIEVTLRLNDLDVVNVLTWTVIQSIWTSNWMKSVILQKNIRITSENHQMDFVYFQWFWIQFFLEVLILFHDADSVSLSRSDSPSLFPSDWL